MPQGKDTGGGLQTTTEHTGPAVVLHVDGEIDASNGKAWQHLIIQGAAETVAPGPFVIDVRGLDFMGSVSYAALAREAVHCRRRGVNMRLVSGQRIVARTIIACGLRRLLPMYTTVEDALSSPIRPNG